MSRRQIPVNEPLLGDREAEYVLDCVRTGWISSAGTYLERFEREWAAYCGRRHGVAVSNGTTALQVAARAIGLGAGDEVIMPTFTIISCALAVVETGARPVLVDSDPDLYTMDVKAIEARVTPRTRAIMPVHIYGHPCDMDPILDVACRHGLKVIEDAAEAHGATYRGRRAGSFGDVSCFSFYANKIVTTGEGGMVLTDDDGIAERLRSLRNLAFRRERRFFHTELGYNYRLTNIQSAIGLAQVERLDELLARKVAMGRRYTAGLRGTRGIQLPVEREWATNVYWMYGLVLDDGIGLDAVVGDLAARGVETRPFFLGMHEQPVFHQMGLFKGECYPVAERIARQGFYLPSGLALREDDIDYVVAATREVMTHHAAGSGRSAPARE